MTSPQQQSQHTYLMIAVALAVVTVATIGIINPFRTQAATTADHHQTEASRAVAAGAYAADAGITLSDEDLVAMVKADCLVNGQNPCPEITVDNVQNAMKTWICPLVSEVLKDTNGNVPKALVIEQTLATSGNANYVANARLSELAINRNLC
jgi:hypothetical protein